MKKSNVRKGLVVQVKFFESEFDDSKALGVRKRDFGVVVDDDRGTPNVRFRQGVFAMWHKELRMVKID